MNGLRLMLRQVRFENRAFWRNPASAFFTCIFPIMFLVIFNLLFGNNEFEVPGGITTTSTFYVPAIAAFSVISATFTNIAISVVIARDLGFLKRVRGTPLPPWAYLGGRILHSVVLSVLLVVLVTAFGALFYGVDVPTTTLPALLVTLAVGAATFCALGLAVTGITPNGDAAPAVTNAIILPLLFISDVFIPQSNAPEWVTTVANVFPIIHFSEALQTPFNPFETGGGFEPEHLAVMAAWLVVGIIAAVWTFTWEPRR